MRAARARAASRTLLDRIRCEWDDRHDVGRADARMDAHVLAQVDELHRRCDAGNEGLEQSRSSRRGCRRSGCGRDRSACRAAQHGRRTPPRSRQRPPGFALPRRWALPRARFVPYEALEASGQRVPEADFGFAAPYRVGRGDSGCQQATAKPNRKPNQARIRLLHRTNDILQTHGRISAEARV